MVSCVFTNVIIVSTARLAFPGQCPIRVIFRASVRSAIGSGDPARPGRPRAYVIAVQHAEHGTRRRRRRLLRLSQWLLSGLRVSRRPRPGPRGPGPFSPAPPALHRDCLSWWLRESSQLAPRPALPRLRAGGRRFGLAQCSQWQVQVYTSVTGMLGVYKFVTRTTRERKLKHIRHSVHTVTNMTLPVHSENLATAAAGHNRGKPVSPHS